MKRIATVLLMLCAAGASAYGVERNISLSESIDRALDRNHDIAVQREAVQGLARQRRVEQGIGRDQGGHARGRRAAEARTQRNPLVQREREPERQVERIAQGEQGAAGGVARGLQRELLDAGDVAVDRIDAHGGRVDAAHRGDVAGAIDRMAEEVEADPDIADAGGRECADCSAHAWTPTPVLSECAIASTSPNTPAAVTCGPAPGPCTTSGLSA